MSGFVQRRIPVGVKVWAWFPVPAQWMLKTFGEKGQGYLYMSAKQCKSFECRNKTGGDYFFLAFYTLWKDETSKQSIVDMWKTMFNHVLVITSYSMLIL